MGHYFENNPPKTIKEFTVTYDVGGKKFRQMSHFRARDNTSCSPVQYYQLEGLSKLISLY